MSTIPPASIDPTSIRSTWPAIDANEPSVSASGNISDAHTAMSATCPGHPSSVSSNHAALAIAANTTSPHATHCKRDRSTAVADRYCMRYTTRPAIIVTTSPTASNAAGTSSCNPTTAAIPPPVRTATATRVTRERTGSRRWSKTAPATTTHTAVTARPIIASRS